MWSFIFVFFLLLVFPPKAQAAQWYYPIDHYYQRQTIKSFGQLINDNFYQGKESLFPFNRFYGYHAGIDLESFPQELDQKVPLYAIGDGTISYIGSLPGYGGVILEQLDLENATALYGHVKIQNLNYKVADKVKAGKILTYLGDAFSTETSKERKHLHFAINIGTDLYFHGHEQTLEILSAKWLDPNIYLNQKGAVLPGSAQIEPLPFSSHGFFETLLIKIKNLFLDLGTAIHKIL